MGILSILLSGVFAFSASVEFADFKPASVSAETATIHFKLKKGKKSLGASDLRDTHERRLHVFVYDPSLNEFQHVHPQFAADDWEAGVRFKTDGRYWLWAQGEETDGSAFTISRRLEVKGLKPAHPAKPDLKDSRTGADGTSVATLDDAKLAAGKMAMLNVTLTRSDGKPVAITPYLGAFAHVVVVPASGDQLLHVHPMNGAKPNEGMVHVTFPKAGLYRVWIQFMDAEQPKTVALSVKVD